MLCITELTDAYIKNNYTPELQKTIYFSFMLQEMMNVSFYEDKYVNLISKEDSIDNDEKRDQFVNYLNRDITAIINSYFITLDEEVDIKLFEKNNIVHFLYSIQRLEDYDKFSYHLNSNLSNKILFCNLLTNYTLMPLPRAMEVIYNVEVKLISSLIEFCNNKKNIAEEKTDKDFYTSVKYFIEFTKGTTSLGVRLYTEGYKNVTLKELSELVSFNIADYIDKNILTNQTQTFLDVFSLLVTTKDDYKTTLVKFKKNSSLLTSKLENVTKINNGILAMLSDFNAFVDFKTESLKHVN